MMKRVHVISFLKIEVWIFSAESTHHLLSTDKIETIIRPKFLIFDLSTFWPQRPWSFKAGPQLFDCKSFSSSSPACLGTSNLFSELFSFCPSFLDFLSDYLAFGIVFCPFWIFLLKLYKHGSIFVAFSEYIELYCVVWNSLKLT